MNDVLAAKVLMSHLPEIADGAYKTAIEIAIETLFQDALHWYNELYKNKMKPWEYLGLIPEEYDYWVYGIKG